MNHLKDMSLLERQQKIGSLCNIDKNSPFFAPLLFDPNVVGKKNCENLVGQVSIPVGIAGPVSAVMTTNEGNIQLTDILIPLATTEGALVASINRGCKLLNECKTTVVNIKNVGMSRAPVFSCNDSRTAKNLTSWIKNNLTKLGSIGESTSDHLTYLDCQIFQKDDLVFARFSFDTGSAMGMNMVTIATSAIAAYIVTHNPKVTCPSVSSNVCTDKKTSAINRRLGRGRWVTVTCNLSADLISSILKTDSTSLLATYHTKIVIGSRLAGLSGRNMHIANAAASFLTATGQDIAHTVDISQGSLTLRKNRGGIIARLSLPSVPVGTIGGGTSLPSQTTARSLITTGKITSDILAAAIGIAALAGELSGLAALSTNSLSSSHQRLGRL
jgi:hydroxymethylglutaryl-CoA reductase (NADPH)